jgi:uncharacterized membrane protein
MSNVKKITISGVVIAIYIIVMVVTQSFAFGQYQVRIATSIYGLSYLFPFLIIPMGIANLISNTLMGGLGLLDMFGGAIVGVIASTLIYLIKRFKLNEWFILLPIILVPGLLVPIWLSYLLHLPYSALAISLCIGQIIPGIVGVILVKSLKNKINIFLNL